MRLILGSVSILLLDLGVLSSLWLPKQKNIRSIHGKVAKKVTVLLLEAISSTL